MPFIKTYADVDNGVASLIERIVNGRCGGGRVEAVSGHISVARDDGGWVRVRVDRRGVLQTGQQRPLALFRREAASKKGTLTLSDLI